jgi:hypothetical protein
MLEETAKYTELISKIIVRLEKIWQEGEGRLEIIVTDDKGEKKAKILGGETERIN